jgi:hypothetical protein
MPITPNIIQTTKQTINASVVTDKTSMGLFCEVMTAPDQGARPIK